MLLATLRPEEWHVAIFLTVLVIFGIVYAFFKEEPKSLSFGLRPTSSSSDSGSAGVTANVGPKPPALVGSAASTCNISDGNNEWNKSALESAWRAREAAKRKHASS